MLRYTAYKDQKLTKEQLKKFQEASNQTIVFDEDCPELSEETIYAFSLKHNKKMNKILYFSNILYIMLR